jgi:hypothetical protein
VKPNTLLFVEFLFFDVAAVAFGVWQWWTVRPRRDKGVDSRPSDEGPGHPER